VVIAVAATVLLIFTFSPLLLDRLERSMISTGPNSPETLATVGVAYERLKIPSGSRLLDARAEEPPFRNPGSASSNIAERSLGPAALQLYVHPVLLRE